MMRLATLLLPTLLPFVHVGGADKCSHVGGVVRIFIKVIDHDNSVRISIVGLYR